MVPIVSPCPEGLEYLWQRGLGSAFFGTSYFLSQNPCWGNHLCPCGIYSFALLRTQHWSHRPSTITCIPHLKRYSRRLCSRTLKETCVMLRWFSVFGCKDWMIISSWSKYLTVTVARVHSISCKGSWLSCCAELFQKIRCIKFWQTYSGLK